MIITVSPSNGGRTDLTLFKGINQLITLKLKDEYPIDLTGSNISINILDSQGDPVSPLPDINVTPLMGEVTLKFISPIIDEMGAFTYSLMGENQDVITRWVFGQIKVEPVTPGQFTIKSWLEVEVPPELTLSENYINQKTQYWLMTLAPLANPAISLEDTLDESKWPPLVKALIAKLIIYEALLLASRGSYIAFINSSSTTETTGESISTGEKGGVKKITTGPSEVEWFDGSDTLSKMFKTTSNSVDSPFTLLMKDVCLLARRLKISLYICPQPDITIPPIVFKRGIGCGLNKGRFHHG